MSGTLLSRAGAALAGADLARCHGRVSNLIGLIIEATGLQAEVGEVCLVGATEAGRHSPAASIPVSANAQYRGGPPTRADDPQ